MPATIRDVARMAEVSVATVSRVFNDSGRVREETRRRILEAARKLRYTPNSAARSLITRRTKTIGVVLPDLYGEFFSELIRGIDEEARESGYHLLVSSANNDQRRIEGALRVMRGRVDGLLVMSPDLDAGAIAARLPERLPVVLLNCSAEGSVFDALDVDSYGGAYAMVEHLLGHGHRRVAIVRGPEQNQDARARLGGYRDALRDGGGEGSPELEIPGDFTEASGYRAAAALLARRPGPTAVFAANDAMAVGLLGALHEAGMRVPEDIAVAGFDDIPIARYVNPPLSSVHVAIDELGAHGVERLLKAVDVDEGHTPRRETLPTALVIRGSCGCDGSRTGNVQRTSSISLTSNERGDHE